jgi:hypothetical protein
MSKSWWSIEVLHGQFSADRWRDAYAPALIEAAVTHGVRDWSWHRTDWGLVLELAFADTEAWTTYRLLPGVQAALDAVPDPVRGLFVYPGRGGSANVRQPVRPRPHLGAGAAPMPVTPEDFLVARLSAVA